MKFSDKVKLKKAWNRFRDNALTIIVAVVITAVLVVILGCYFANLKNKISEGTVVDKSYTAGWTSSGTGDTPSRYHPPRCELTISGEKNGEYVEYTFDVPEAEYVMYNVGDHYPKRQEE